MPNPTYRRLTSRRTTLTAILAGLAGATVLPRHGLAQHPTMQPPAGTPADGKATLVFAAATLKSALDAIVQGYRQRHGDVVTIAYGPTPGLAKQIENGAPTDLFLSADPVWMDYLAERRLVRRHTRADLVGNVLILAGQDTVSPATPAVIDRDFALSAAVGSGPLCMCNPADHPAGRYGKVSLEALGLWDAVAGRIAIVDNPQVAVTMVARGDAPAAVVFATDIKDVAGTRALGAFADSSYPPIVYPAAVTMNAPHAEAAGRLLDHLRSADARAIFDRYGYR